MMSFVINQPQSTLWRIILININPIEHPSITRTKRIERTNSHLLDNDADVVRSITLIVIGYLLTDLFTIKTMISDDFG